MTHYETLGCAPDCSPEELKRAFRRARSAAHPDRHGGSEDAMKELNRAFTVLSDPERRAFYDATGLDDPRLANDPATLAATASRVALKLLQDLFAQLLEKIDSDRKLFEMARYNLERMQEATQSELNQARSRTKKLATRRERISAKAGEANLIHAIIDEQLDTLKDQVLSLEAKLEVIAAALPLVDHYETTEPLFQEPSRRPSEYGEVQDAFLQALTRTFGSRGAR